MKYVCCAYGSGGGQRPSLGGYVTGTGGHEWGDHRRRAFMLPILLKNAVHRC